MIDGSSVSLNVKVSPKMADAFKHLDKMVQQAIERQAVKEHAIIKDMLGRWVSELEPVIVRQRSSQWTDDGAVISSGLVQIIGLTAKGHNTIAVRRY